MPLSGDSNGVLRTVIAPRISRCLASHSKQLAARISTIAGQHECVLDTKPSSSPLQIRTSLSKMQPTATVTNVIKGIKLADRYAVTDVRCHNSTMSRLQAGAAVSTQYYQDCPWAWEVEQQNESTQNTTLSGPCLSQFAPWCEGPRNSHTGVISAVRTFDPPNTGCMVGSSCCHASTQVPQSR